MTERDCFIHDQDCWFRYRAAAVILDQDRVLMARNDRDSYHYSIGGGVHHMETAEDAVRREVLEETGVEMTIRSLAFVHENFWSDRAGGTTRYHELAFYFLMDYRPGMPLDLRPKEALPGLLEWVEWVDLADYGRSMPAYPTFFATELPCPAAAPRWITSRE